MLAGLLVASLATAGSAQTALKPVHVLPDSLIPWDARYGAATSKERVAVWDLAKGRQVGDVELPLIPYKDAPESGQQTTVEINYFSADDRWLAVSGYDSYWRGTTPNYRVEHRPFLMILSVPDFKVLGKITADKGSCDVDFGIIPFCPKFQNVSFSPDGSKLFYTLLSQMRSVHGPKAHLSSFGWIDATALHHETVTLSDRSGRASFKREVEVEYKAAEGGVEAHFAYDPEEPRTGFLSDGRPALLYADNAGCTVKGTDGQQLGLLEDCTGDRKPSFDHGKIVSSSGPIRVWDPVTGNLLAKSDVALDSPRAFLSDDLTAVGQLDLPGGSGPDFSTATVTITDLASGKVLLRRLIESPHNGDAAYGALYDRADSRLVVYARKGALVYALGAVAQAAPAVAAETASAVDIDAPPSSAKAAVDPDAYAVVIGIEKYRQDGIPAVDFAARDASSMYGYLTRAMGYDPKNVLLLTDDKATKNDLQKNLGPWLRNRVTAKSRVFVYYAGHGAPNPTSGEGYLMPYDGDPAYVEDTAFPIASLYADLGKLPTKDVTVVLDACFSGQGGRSLLAKGARPLVSTKSLPSSANAAVLAAASGGQISASDPERRHGLLTGYLLEALHGAADARGDGRITGDEIYAYVRPAVERAARLQNVEQTPTFTKPQGEARPWIVLKASR